VKWRSLAYRDDALADTAQQDRILVALTDGQVDQLRRARLLRAQARRWQDQEDAIRSLKRHISNAVYRQLVIDAARTR
jgi:hypothetical protein